jgi:ribosomal protein S18 acetylase RimI-like enzyme
MATFPDQIGDVTFRGYGGESDFVGMVAMLKEQARYDGVDRHDSVDDMANSYRHLTNCDLATDLIIAERAGEIVGYSRVFWWIEEATADRVLGFIGWDHPAVRDLSIQQRLAEWSEARLREVVVEHPYSGSQILQSWASEPERSKIEVLQEAGFAISQTYTQMTRSLDDPIPECPLPAGLEFRSTTSADIRRVWEAAQEAFRDHVGHSPSTETDFERFAAWPNLDTSLWKVVFDGEEIAGQVLNFFDEDENRTLGKRRGWTEDISVQRKWRNQGVAKAAIAESMRMFKEMGMTEVALEVHTTNPTGAYQLYEGLGYEVIETGHEFRKRLQVG